MMSIWSSCTTLWDDMAYVASHPIMPKSKQEKTYTPNLMVDRKAVMVLISIHKICCS